ncbi:MAG: AraC family transcriptional regulator [Planctomycetes bacterium]|nr:AraC family transcriptional regulator [Planctomycetota bacterium]
MASVQTLALAAGLHPAHFARLFRRATGTTLRAWRRGVRVERSLALLRAGGTNEIDAIALCCGFADQAHFTRAFRAEVGIPPGAWCAWVVGAAL